MQTIARLLRRSVPLTLAAATLLAAGSAAAATYLYTFSNMPAGTSFVFGDSLTPNGATIEFKKFQWSGGTWFSGGVATIVPSNHAGGVANELNLNNINVRIIPDTPAITAGYKYADFGGNVNLGVNGDLRNVNNLIDVNGDVVGGCDVIVTEFPMLGGVFGEVEILCPDPVVIDMFGVGGQEFFIDDVTFED